MKIKIKEINKVDKKWSEFLLFYKDNLEEYVEVIKGYEQRGTKSIIALSEEEDKILGLLRLIITPIGPEDGLPILRKGKDEVIQAKIMDFFVLPSYRGRGIGRLLQEKAIVITRSLSCYQLSSFSYFPNEANHSLKLSMGFSVRPEFRKNKTANGLYFIMPLQTNYS